jgi:hypothetical protein
MDERRDENQDPTTDLENFEVTELDDKDLEDASGGTTKEPPTINGNCNC